MKKIKRLLARFEFFIFDICYFLGQGLVVVVLTAE